MLPPKRLESLLSQAVELQQERCTYHVKPGKLTLDDVSLLKDHACTKYVLCFRTKLLQLSMLTSSFTASLEHKLRQNMSVSHKSRRNRRGS
jgi:hypothetical protein